MNSTQKRYIARLQELIDQSKEIEALVKYPSGQYISLSYIEDQASLNAWLIKINTIIEIAFGKTSPHYKGLQELTKKDIHEKSQINAIKGLLIGSLDDLDNGFLLGQEFLIAGEIFDSILEEAKELLNIEHKDLAAILGRIVLEDALKKLARLENINEAQKASQISIELKKAGRYNLTQDKFIQAWLDVGNNAAHGKFDQYSKEQVKEQIEGIERFIASEFKI